MRGPLNRTNPDKPALVAGQEQYTYDQVDLQVQRFASGILAGADDLSEERIAFLIPASPEYVTVMHGIWRAGGIAIPLNTASADAELEHCLTSTGVNRLIAVEPFLERIRPLCDKLGVVVSLVADHLSDNLQPMPEVSADRRALIIFTSGTTNLPKGVVTTHKNINAQITTLVDAWAWSENDVIPLFLPLHHVHGIINVLSCALWAGATVHLMERLDIEKLCGEAVSGTYNLFMAVPTIYVKLIDHIEGLDAETAQPIKAAFGAMRLNVSGSAACPVAIFEAWQRLTGQVLLERYGMTEIGMALSNPYVGERRAGSVGQPFPGVTVQLFNEDHQPVTEASESGEIRVKSDTVFLEYWNNPKATAESFRDGWFCTGDIAVIEGGYFRIMGRSSIDIIKSGGYKLSALEIEGKLLAHPAIAEVAVLGIEDRTWGESVAAVAVLREGQTLNIDALKTWCEGKLSSYKLPKTLVITSELPRNAMGKIVKPKLKALF